MSMTIDESLTPSAITEYHAVKSHGGEEGAAWQAAVARVRYDVLLMAILTCEERGRTYAEKSPEDLACHDCATTLRALL
jgi:hypothetical protein